MTSLDNALPPRPYRTSTPELTPVEIPDFSDRGGPRLTSPHSTGVDTWRLRPKVERPAYVAPAIPDAHADIEYTKVSVHERASPEYVLRPREPVPTWASVVIALAMAAGVIYAVWSEQKRRERLKR